MNEKVECDECIHDKVCKYGKLINDSGLIGVITIGSCMHQVDGDIVEKYNNLLSEIDKRK